MLDEDEKLVSVATYDSPYLAEIAKLRLESEGIPVLVPGRAPSPFTAGHTAPWGGLQLKVRESDEVRAIQILRKAADSDSADDLSPRCPQCGSEDVRLERPAVWRSFLGAVRELPFVGLLWRRRPSPDEAQNQMPYHCRSCQYTWKSPANEEAS